MVKLYHLRLRFFLSLLTHHKTELKYKIMKRSCFTLMELIVVISIIALLMAILVPFLQKSRQQTKAVLCGSNIKQLLLCLISYETQNLIFPYGFDDDRSDEPPEGYYGFSYDKIGWWWFNYLEDFHNARKKITVLQCPARNLESHDFKDNILCGNYGVNQFICKIANGYGSYVEYELAGTPLSSDDIQHPSETLLIVDSGYSIITWWHACDSPPVTLGSTIEETAYIPGLCINTERNFLDGQEKDAVNGRHPNKTVNVGFVDGHVSRLKADDLLVEEIDDEVYKNLSPLWVPKMK